MVDLNFRDILVKKPFFSPIPKNDPLKPVVDSTEMANSSDDLQGVLMTQADFVRQFYPQSHVINDPTVFPDIYKKDPVSGNYYLQPVTRCAFAFQQLIAEKQILHLTGNNMQFELGKKADTEEQENENNELFATFIDGWNKKKMEIVFYDAVRSVKITADTAVIGYMKDGKFGMKTLSYQNGDILYPHFDSLTGELLLFARTYYDYDEKGVEKTQYVEVWDNKYIYTARRNTQENVVVSFINKIFGLSGFSAPVVKPHGFSRIPVAYFRNDDGPAWIFSQNSIEQYEEAVSYLSENNKAYAFPIMYLKGDGVSIEGDMNGSVKAITMDSDGDAGFLEKQDASASFATQLNLLYKLIYEQSFAVTPPELKSGDLPGVAVKLLFSPAIEKATNDANAMQDFVDDITDIFKEGYGKELGIYTKLAGLNINTWVQPYVHQNQTELITNIATAVQNKFLSKQTATERCPDFPKNDEFDRIMREIKEAQKLDIEKTIITQDNATNNAIKQNRSQTLLTRGQDVNTGRQGRPNRSGHEWDENGNYEGESNWDEFDKKRSLT